MVMAIVRALGLTPVDQGSLLAAQEIENYPLQLFPMWKFPVLLSLGLTAFFFFYCLARDVIYPYVYENKDFSFFIAISIPNRICPILALILLALVYLPGVLAAIIQLYRGTKYHRFPDWLDKWMLCRKQLGLVALAFASLHVLYTLLIPIRFFVRWRISSRIVSQVGFVPCSMSSFLLSLLQRLPSISSFRNVCGHSNVLYNTVVFPVSVFLLTSGISNVCGYYVELRGFLASVFLLHSLYINKISRENLNIKSNLKKHISLFHHVPLEWDIF